MLKVSIIVPVYNNSRYLNQCINSIVSVPSDEFELILINDGSTDDSGKICDEYASYDNRIRVIHKTNAGCGAARNSGLEIAKGEYILFCDSDDYYDTKELMSLIEGIDRVVIGNSLLAFNYKNIWQDKTSDRSNYRSIETTLNNVKERIEFVGSQEAHKTLGYAVWDKLYSKEIIQKYNIRVHERNKMLNEDDWAEDLSFNLRYFLHIKEIEVLDKAIYCLRKTGTVYEQTELHLVSKIEHMVRLLYKIYCDEKANEDIEKMFWSIAVWHLKRYFYLDAQHLGVKELRGEIDNSQYSVLIKKWISKALQNWTEYGIRWNEKESKDYKILLEYLLDGNLLKYKIKSKLLWRKS